MLFAQHVDQTIMEMVTHALLEVLDAFIRVVTSAIRATEQGLRDGLDSIHVGGDLQTLIVALVPILFLALVLKLMGGVLRVTITLVLLLLLAHILAPVVERLIHGS